MFDRESPFLRPGGRGLQTIAAGREALGLEAKLQSKLLEAYGGRTLVSQERLRVARVGRLSLRDY